MISTKQFTIFFLLVVVFLVAIMTVTSLAWRESSREYDTTSIKDKMMSIVDFSADRIKEQEHAMDTWVTEVDIELGQAQTKISEFEDHIDEEIGGHGPMPRPSFWPR